MVGKRQDPEVPDFFQPPQNGPYDLLVEVLDGLDFILQVSVMGSFVGCLQMDIDKVLPGNLPQGVFGLSPVIGVQVAGRPRNVDDFQTGIGPDPLGQVHRGDDRSL